MSPPAATLHRLARCAACARQFDLTLDARLRRLDPGATFLCSCGADVVVPSPRAEDAAVVACAACGAPREGFAPNCTFCGSDYTLRELDLDAVCPRCGARVSRRGRFCHHCSLPLTAPREGAPSEHRCPACAPPAVASQAGLSSAATAEPVAAAEAPLLTSRRVAGGRELHLFACPRCAGLWLDRDVFNALVEDARQGRNGLPAPPAAASDPAAPGGLADRHWRYRPCAVCGALMNRRNYAQRSGVVVDLCKQHGIWFDGDELHRVLTWVAGGGATEAEVMARAPRPPVTLVGAGGGGVGGGLDGGLESGWGRWLRGDQIFDVVLFAIQAAIEWASERQR